MVWVPEGRGGKERDNIIEYGGKGRLLGQDRERENIFPLAPSIYPGVLWSEALVMGCAQE